MATKRRTMRIHRPLGLLFLATVLLWSGCKPSEPVPESRWRFVGGTTLTLQTNAPALRAVLSLPESLALRGPLLTNAAQLLWHVASGKTNAPADALAAALPLVADLADRLSIGETILSASGYREFALAVQGDAPRAQAWQAAWPKFIAAAQAAQGGTPGKPQVAILSGWIVAVSDSGLITPETALKSLAQIPAEPQVVLHLEAKVPGWPAGVLSVAVRDGAVRSQLKVSTGDSLPQKLPAWKIPPFVKDPLVEFTAARGVTPWLAELPAVGPFLQSAPPSQWFVWAYGDVSLQTYIAGLTDNPEKLIAGVHDQLKDAFKPGRTMGQLDYQPDVGLLKIIGLPIAFPLLTAVHTNDASYVTFGAFATRPRVVDLPKEMVAQVQRDNLMLYDWEISAAVAQHWNAFRQLNQIVHTLPLNNRTPGQKWLTAITPKLGNCVTEALVTGEHELTVTRNSSVGLSALELTELAWSLDGQQSSRLPRPTPTAAPKASAGIAKPPTASPSPHK